MSNSLNQLKVGRAIQMVESGSSFREVGRHFSVDKNVISRIYKRYQATGEVERSGRKRKWTEKRAGIYVLDLHWILRHGVDISRKMDKLGKKH